MKLCKDCKYFQEASDKEAFCLHPYAVKYDDPIYGEHTKMTCREMRLGENAKTLCGKLGRVWMPKPGFVMTTPEVEQ